ncbi:MAG: hypothetical protein WCS73_07500 [Lentisphaeria bacterium]
METISVDFGKPTGKEIKPLHGINNSPVALHEPLPELKQAGIPFVRLHDTGGAYGANRFVDIPNIFPDFDADETDPKSYLFEFTDAYFKQLIASGMKIFYRLGVTIENEFRIHAYRIDPPKDPAKWARICEHIVRHYNEGWANGFHFDIEYWEIWNEPENPPMWTGTREQYFELYRVTANHLKKCFPTIKVGGYASCGFYAVNRPNRSDFYKGFLTWYDEFLKFVNAKDTKCPLDFYSWHLYTNDPNEIMIHANYVQEKLEAYGMQNTENIFDEWNYMSPHIDTRWDDMKEAPGAAFVAAAFTLMQKGCIDKAMYYDALPTRAYCGLYYFPHQNVTKTYHSFLAYNELFKLKNEVESSANSTKQIYVCAAADSHTEAVLAINNNPEACGIDWDIKNQHGKAAALIINQHNVFQPIPFDKNFEMPAYSVLLIKYSDKRQVFATTQKDTSQHSFNGIDENKK